MTEAPAFIIQSDVYPDAIVIAPANPWPSGDWRHWIVETDQIAALVALLAAHLPPRTCATCRHWQPEDLDWAHGAWAWRAGSGFCGRAASSDGKMLMDTRALAEDTDSYHAQLRTWPDFGCVQWEAKSDG